MSKASLALHLASGLLLMGCGQTEPAEEVPGEVVANQLDNAADQSSPAARDILKEAAEEARDFDRLPPASEPGSFAQDAMEKAGNAEAAPITARE